MLNGIQYDISGLLILTVIISLFFLKKTAPSYPNRTFALIVAALFTAVFLNVAEHFLFLYTELNQITARLFSALKLTAAAVVPVPFTLYTLALTNTIDTLPHKKVRLMLLPPLFINILLITLVLFIPVIPGFDGPILITRVLLLCTYFFSLYYVAAGIIILCKNRTALPDKTIKILLFFVGVSLTASLIQFIFPHLNIQGLFFSLSTLIVSLTVQKSEDTTDSITGLYNHTAFEAMNYRRLKTGEKFYITGIVFDDLSFLIGTLGMRTMNDVLKQTSGFLKSALKNTQIYHFNDGKFAVVFPKNNLEAVYSCIEVIKTRFLQPWSVTNLDVKIFPRISIIACPQDADSTESVIELLDLLSSDDTYKREDVILASVMDTSIHKRYAYLDRTVKNSLTEGLIDVYYQPIFCTKSSKIIGAEALIRMKDENGKFVSPEEFIPVAEKNGTILRLGEFVFEKVCRLLSDIKPEEYGIQKIDVNLSVVQCMQERLAAQIITIANLYKIPFSLLNMEITETAAAYSQETLKKNMQNLSDAGIELSLDDYGSGYSNIGYMLNLPFNMIKIDKGIVWNAFTDDKSHTALAFTISMINALKMTVLAEGIETQEQADTLTSLGCQYLQGYYFSEPLPKDVFLQLLYHQKIELEAEGLNFNQSVFAHNPALNAADYDKGDDIPPYMSEYTDAEEVEELDSLDEAEYDSLN